VARDGAVEIRLGHERGLHLHPGHERDLVEDREVRRIGERDREWSAARLAETREREYAPGADELLRAGG
jgi:hypothetical protein